jgi:hypothetical protein
MKLRQRRKIDSRKAFVRWVEGETPWYLALGFSNIQVETRVYQSWKEFEDANETAHTPDR